MNDKELADWIQRRLDDEYLAAPIVVSDAKWQQIIAALRRGPEPVLGECEECGHTIVTPLKRLPERPLSGEMDLATAYALAQTEIKGHMRIEDDLKRDLGLERESHEVTKRMLSDRDDRIAELEKAALRVVEASDRDTKKGLSQQVAVENFSDSRPEEIEYIEAHLALLEAIGQLDEALKSRA